MSHRCYLTFFSSIFLFLSILLYINVSSVNSHQDIDSKAYISNAITFYNHNSFIKPGQSADIPYYSMGYAFFIGIIYKIFGISDSGVNNFALIWIQVLLALLTGFLIFKITNYLFDKKTALISFAIFSLNLGFLVFSQFILTEILLAFFLVLFLERFVLFLNSNLLSYLMQAAFVLGISIWVKPAALYFIFPVILFLLFAAKNKKISKIKSILLFSVFFYLPILGYMTFNKVTYNQFVVGALGNENLYFYFLPKVIAQQKNTDVDKETTFVRLLVTGNKLEHQSWEKVNKLFWRTFKSSPVLFFKVWLINVGKTFAGLFTTNLKVLIEESTRGGDVSFFKTKGGILQRSWSYIAAGTNSDIIKIIGLSEAIWNAIRYLLCSIALISLALKKQWKIFFLFSFFVFYFSMITGHDGCARFRMMFEFVLIILAAKGTTISWKISKGS